MSTKKRKSDEVAESSDKKQKTSLKANDFADKNNDNNVQIHEVEKKNPSFLNDHTIFILKAGIEKARLQIFETQLKKYGGLLSPDYNEKLTYIVVDEKSNAAKVCRLLKLDKPPENIPLVKTTWLSACFRTKSLVDVKDYTINVEDVRDGDDNKSQIGCTQSTEVDTKKNLFRTNETSKGDTSNKAPITKVGVMYNAFTKPVNNDSDSDYVESDDSDFVEGSGSNTNTSDFSSDTSNASPVKNFPVGSWTCARSSKNPKPNLNQAITSKLEEMVKNYESTNDKWRAFGYQKAIQALRSYPKPITTWEEARNLRGVGTKLADKIWEIVQSGELRKLNEFKSSDDIKILNMFTDVWGAGPTTARAWYQQGFRSLEDLRTKAKLTHQQEVGVRLYDDLIERMPRSEAGEIEVVVKEAAESIQDGIIAQACGSYRRGKATCGDVDVLITHPDGKSHKGIFSKIISKLTHEGFLTDHLVSVEDSGNQKKYLGVCKLKGENRKHRRLDIIVVPYDEYGCALVYFTGSAHFNRSLRHLAKKMNMSLNEHALKYGVVRKGNEKIHEGTVIPTPTEASVFEQFKIPYRPPEERDH